jgi:hypothetical protein
MMQPGDVFTDDDYAHSASAPWSYRLYVATGTSDLIAVSRDRIEIRRKLKVPSSATLATIDLDAEGTLLTHVPFTLYPVSDGELITSNTNVTTDHGFAMIDGTDKELLLAPPSFLQPAEAQRFSIAASSKASYRSIAGTFAGNAIFELMPEVAKTALTYTIPDNRSLRLDWTSLPAADEIELDITDYLHSQSVNTTQSFLDATGHKYVAFATPPDFDHDWHVNLIGTYYRTLAIYRYTGTTRWTSERREIVTNVLGN